MKRGQNAGYPSYAVKTIPSNVISKGKGNVNKRPLYPCDVGNLYVTVPVCKMSTKFSKKQMKEALSAYYVESAGNHSFVLSQKYDPSVKVAIPYYRVGQTVSNGRTVACVGNFYPVPTILATPPPGADM